MSDPHPEISEDRLYFHENQTIAVHNLDAEGHILDIGGGGEGIIGKLKGEQVVAIDANRRELEEAPGGPLKIVMDATELQFLDGTFGLVSAFYTLMYIQEDQHQRVFEEVLRVLAPGGRFLVWDVEIPPRAGETQDIIVFPLTIELPGETVTTGYGTRWPEGGRRMGHYVQLAGETGFETVSQALEGQSLHLELRKPQAGKVPQPPPPPGG